MDADQTCQRRATRRAILNWCVNFLDYDFLHGSLEWIRDPNRCSCPVLFATATHDAVLDERCYILRELLLYEDDTKWSKNQVASLRKKLVESSDSCSLTFSINQVKVELAFLQADMNDCEAFEATKRMNDEELKARAHDIATSLEAVEEQELPGGPQQSPWLWNGCALSPSAFALHRTELLEDLRCISVQLSHNAPEKERVRQRQQRLNAWELSGAWGYTATCTGHCEKHLTQT